MKYKAFHKLSYGLYVVASGSNEKKAGYIANTVFQVTSEPQQIAVSCHKNNKTAEVIRSTNVFSVSVLRRDLNIKIIGDFGFMSGADYDKFSGVNTRTAVTGAPIVVDESVAWFDCRVRETIDLGSHFLFIGEVLESEMLSDEDPLTYQHYREKHKMLSPKNSPTYIEGAKLEAEEPVSVHTPEPSTAEQEAGSAHVCVICGYTYNPENGDPVRGIPPGTPFEDLPEDYRCPICNATKNYFKEL